MLKPEVPSTVNLSSTVTESAHREPQGSNLIDPSLQLDLSSESDLSGTDSSTESDQTFLNRATGNLNVNKNPKMDNSQPLAEVQTAKMKDCPVLTAGRITPLILQSWALACK